MVEQNTGIALNPMNKYLVILLLIASHQLATAQGVTGKWKTYDIFNNNKPESIVFISIVNNSLYVIIDEIIPEDHKNDLCTKCTGNQKNKPIKGMVILEAATLKNGIWQGAQILNAKNGKEYGCQISLAAPDLLKVRGFVGYPIFGKTLYWTRVKQNEFR